MNGETVGYAAAFGGGVVSFLSPCVLPLVPAYLSIVTGLDASEIEQPTRRHLGRIARDTGLFVAGFSTVFILLGLTATGVGQFLVTNQATLTRISGAMVLAFSLFLIGSLVLHAPWLYGEKRFHPQLSRLGPYTAPVAGVAFGFGWTPCIGPILGSVLAIAATRGDALQGATLLAVYSLGLGIPFLAAGLAMGRLSRSFGWIKRHFTALTVVSAASLAFFGTLLMFNRLIWVTTQLQSGMRSVGLGDLVTLG